ncbi:MAG TPA: radical SAM family heme chaperone HemW [Bacillota bacterium]|nr:radical SAM family heme chaperone HemW [Bacillota bacterium]
MTVGLYIHVPFCLKRCSYCDFVSYIYEPEAAEAYITDLSAEIRLYGPLLREDEKRVASIFFGGGTPTSLPAASLKTVMDEIGSVFCLLPDCETTVEANPGTVHPRYLDSLAEAGFNRLSLGVQSFDEGLLRVLGRRHGRRDVENAVRWAREAGFQNINLDLIYGIPGQAAEGWLETLERAVAIAPEHISAYGLQLEEGTPLARAVARGELVPCAEETELLMYLKAVDYLTSNGYMHYEISNFAKPGRQCAHNLGYWLNLPYLGLGAAAHSFFRNRRFRNESSLARYHEKLLRGEYPVEEELPVTLDAEMAETMFLGLRLIDGVSLSSFCRRFGRCPGEVYREEIAGLKKAGLIELKGDFLRLTGAALPVANRVFREFA